MIYATQFLSVVLLLLTITSNAFLMPSTRARLILKPLHANLEMSSKPSHLRVGIFGGLILFFNAIAHRS